MADTWVKVVLNQSNKVIAQPESSTPTRESGKEHRSVPGDHDDVGSVFSGFSTDEGDTASLPGIGKADGPFSERMFHVKTILGQLARVSTAIRRSGTKHRYRRADASLKEDDFEDFEKHLTLVVLMGNIVADNSNEPAGAAIRRARLVDSMPPLTKVQKRMIRANIVRRNRIIFATRSMKPVEAETTPRPPPQPVAYRRLPASMIEHNHPQLSQTLPEQASESPAVQLPPATPSVKEGSISRTATEMGSQFDYRRAVEPKAHSVVTQVTRIGAAQDYPSCPKPISDELLQCPYCADLLDAIYSKHQSRWG